MKKIAGIAPTILAVLVAFFLIADVEPAPQNARQPPALTVQAARHMLYGDQSGGGHLHGIGKPCKSEFPAGWDASEIVAYVEGIAANGNLDWKRQDNGYFVAEHSVNGTRVRVVLNHDRAGIVTAYPVGVKRNPCPQRANYNQ